MAKFLLIFLLEGHKFISYAIMCYPRKIKSLLLLLLFITFDFLNHSTYLASASLHYVSYVPTVKGIKHNTQLNDTRMNVPWHLILFNFRQKFNH